MIDSQQLIRNGNIVEGRGLLIREEQVWLPDAHYVLWRHDHVFGVANWLECQSWVNPGLSQVDVKAVVLKAHSLIKQRLYGLMVRNLRKLPKVGPLQDNAGNIII